MAGIRGLGINETLSWFAQDNTPFTKGLYVVWTHNMLVGPQVGPDVFYERTVLARGRAHQGGSPDQLGHAGQPGANRGSQRSSGWCPTATNTPRNTMPRLPAN